MLLNCFHGVPLNQKCLCLHHESCWEGNPLFYCKCYNAARKEGKNKPELFTHHLVGHWMFCYNFV